MGMATWLCGGWTGLVFLFLYAPIVLLVIYSFNSSEMGFLWEGFSVRWYGELWRNTQLLDAMKNSLIVATATTALSAPLGTSGAWLLYRYRFPARGILRTLIYVPVAAPEVVMGASLLALFSVAAGPLNHWLAHFTEMEFGLGYATIVIAHTTFCFPFVLAAVDARLAGIDPHLEEAAMDLGAPPLQAFWRVIVPYLLPAIVSGAIMAFLLSVDEYIVTFFVTGPQSQTLPIKVFGMAKKGLDPSLNAISAVFVLATAAFVVLAERVRKFNR
jgi:spermidine/putrescine transport system permease protein